MNGNFEIERNIELKKRLIQKLIQLKGGLEEDYEHLSIEELEAQLEVFAPELEAPTIPVGGNFKSEILTSNEEDSKSEIQNSNDENLESKVLSSSDDFIVGIEENDMNDQKILNEFSEIEKSLIPFDEFRENLETIEGEVINRNESAEKEEKSIEVIDGEITSIEPQYKSKAIQSIIPFKYDKLESKSHSNLGNELEKVVLPKIPSSLIPKEAGLATMPIKKQSNDSLPLMPQRKKEESSNADLSLAAPNLEPAYYPKQFKPEDKNEARKLKDTEDISKEKKKDKDEVLKRGASAPVAGQILEPNALAPNVASSGSNNPAKNVPKTNDDFDKVIFYILLIIFIIAVFFILFNFWPEIKEVLNDFLKSNF